MEKPVIAFWCLLIILLICDSSVDDELERIKNLQKEVALRRKRNEASYKAALAGSEFTLLQLLNTPDHNLFIRVTIYKI